MSDLRADAATEEQVYHLGTSDEELDRLGYQHQVWQETTLELWSAADFGFGQSLLDLGCGPGFAALELARRVGAQGQVHAIDASARFIGHLQRCLAAGHVANVWARTGDAHALDLPDGTLDGAFARWLLCFVADPQRVCDEITRVLRPGGAFVAWDYFNYLAVNVFPERAAIRRLFEIYHQSAIDNGGSYDIAQRLPAMMRHSGLELERLVPINRIARPGSPIWRWVSLFNTNYVPKLVESGLMARAEADALHVAWSEAESDPASFFFAPPMLGIVARKPT